MINIRENFCFYFCFVHIAKREGLVEYQQSGFPVNSSSKRRRISSQDSPDDHLSGAKEKVVLGQVFADQVGAGGSSVDVAEVIAFHTETKL